jgi:hypothetical protein
VIVAEISVALPDGSELPGSEPIVIVGPNGSGKTRLSRRLAEQTQSPLEYINALRNTRISAQLPAMSRIQAVQQHDGVKNTARQSPWELASDFDFALAQLLADDGDAARNYRHTHKTGGSVQDIEATPLERAEDLWKAIFPGRSLEWKDWSPVVHNDRQEIITYGANQMSDGERAALYLVSKVLLAAPGTVLVIDEPETHFHSELAVRFWDALERGRPDLRFVYVTHDLPFALSREPATFLLADPIEGFIPIDVNAEIPAEIRKDILGAASFSYYASRVVFCEGEDHSYDKAFLTAWFSGRDTVVKAVSSGQAVRQCVEAFKAANLVSNLDAMGVIDRDYRSDDELKAMEQVACVLPVHEIEAIVCLPPLAERLGAHLAVKLKDGEIEHVVRDAVNDEDVRRVAFERTKLRLRNAVEDDVSGKPAAWDEASLTTHYSNAKKALSVSLDAESIFKEELKLAEATRNEGDAGKILALFPSKKIAGQVAHALGVKVPALFDLLVSALMATDPKDPLHQLGKDVEEIVARLGLPARTVAERPGTSSE